MAVGDAFASAGIRIDDELEQLRGEVVALQERVFRLENATTPEPDPEPTPEPTPDPTPNPNPLPSKLPAFPSHMRVREVSPMSVDDLAKIVRNEQSGTEIRCRRGVYQATGNTRFEFPADVTLVAEPGAIIDSPNWNAGERGYQIKATGQRFGIRGFRFDGGHIGNHLLVEKCDTVWVEGNEFDESWRHSFHYINADNVFIKANHWTNCNRYNADHSKGIWPFVAGGWHYRRGIWNKGIHWENNVFTDCHGEGLHCSFTDGFTIRGNVVSNAINALCYLHTARNGVVEGNTFVAADEFRNHNGALPQAAIRIQNELQNFTADAQGEGTKVTEDIVIRNNVLGGKVRSGIWYKPHSSYPAGGNTYGGIRIEGNTISGNGEADIVFNKPASAVRGQCYSDHPVDTPDGGKWTITN